MRYSLILGLFLILISVGHLACSQNATSESEIQETLTRFFELVDAYNYEAVEEACTQDFELIESGMRMDLEGFISMLRRMEGKVVLSHQLSDFNIKIVGDFAYASYHLSNLNSGTEWIDSVVLLYSSDRWLIDRGHSTKIAKN